MTNEFIPYEQALELKELGFDELCIYAWCNKGGWNKYKMIKEPITQILKTDGNPFGGFFSGKNWNKEIIPNTKNSIKCSAPLYQQAFRWFREKYNLRGFIGFRPNVKQFDCHVYDVSLSGKEYVKQRTMKEFNKDPKVGTYEEAELECLKQLINIVKNKNNEIQ